MEQQAKERLTGGVILVVLLVLLVPELLTGPRPAPSVAPAGPDQAPMRSYTLDIGDPAHAGSAPLAASVASPSVPGVGSAPAASVRATPSPAAAAPATPAPTAPVPPAVPPAAAHAAEPTHAPAREPVRTRAPEPAAAAEHSAERPAGHSTEHPAGRATASWTVQLGTFSSRENAVRLAGRVKSRGFSASISEVRRSGRTLFRVRVGSERDRAAAQKLQGRLRAAGQKGGEVVPR